MMSIPFHKIWIDQCEATEGIRERFGLQNALDYLIGEKLFHFVQVSEQRPEFAAELPAFVAEIRRLFTGFPGVQVDISRIARDFFVTAKQVAG